MDMDAADLQTYLHQQIPLTRAMGLHVEHLDASQLSLSAPLELNHNHLGTAFGGSLAALATAAAYGMLWTLLGNPDLHLVIHSSSLHYHRPVRGPLLATCHRPNDAELVPFLKTLASKNKARITCQVHIHHADEIAMTFTGNFVALGK